jgi:CRP/FNR family transcriptional regulator, anaerobic regulatory protein
MTANIETPANLTGPQNPLAGQPILWSRQALGLSPDLSAGLTAGLSAGLSPTWDAVPLAACKPLSDLLRLMGCPPQAMTALDDSITVAVRSVRAGAALLSEGTRATHVYVVRSGTFKTIKTAEDGYEQVLNFAGTGEVLGFEALCKSHQPLGAVALEDASAMVLPVCELDALRQQSPSLDRALQAALSRQLMRAGAITEMMAAVSSEVRLARFIAWWAARMAEQGQSSRRLRLRMSRRDIASLLGIAHETVSRSFTAFVDRGLLRVDNREIEILDAAGLKDCARNTRGQSEGASCRSTKQASSAKAPRWPCTAN